MAAIPSAENTAVATTTRTGTQQCSCRSVCARQQGVAAPLAAGAPSRMAHSTRMRRWICLVAPVLGSESTTIRRRGCLNVARRPSQ